MPINKCRFCLHDFYKEPLLKYENMPKAAQFLPSAEDLIKEKGVSLNLYQCIGCGLVQLNTDPVPYYKEVIRATAFSEEMKSFRNKQFTNFVQRYDLLGKKIIEIGCGRGEYLSILRQNEVLAYGLEYSATSVAYCRESKLNVFQGFIENPKVRLKEAPFDAFFILNFLEHIPNLNAALRGIYNNLREGALGLVEVPNFDMILQKRLFSEFIPDHLFYFTHETLRNVLALNGFDIVECKNIWHDYIISAVVKKRNPIDLSVFYKDQASLKEQMKNYLARLKNKRIAIWGAGHQALAIMSLMGLTNKDISYVIDSASFKQGKYTPATHIPIVPPKTLSSDPVDAIIVMAASYSDEVVKIIKNNFQRNLDIVVLSNGKLQNR